MSLICPWARDNFIIVLSSCSLWISSCSEAGSNPNSFAITFANEFNIHTSGRITLSNQYIGQATLKQVFSADWIAIVLGTNSPNTTWSNVINPNETTNEIVWVNVSFNLNTSNIGLNNAWNVDSPSQPSPKDTIVIPNCVADK